MPHGVFAVVCGNYKITEYSAVDVLPVFIDTSTSLSSSMTSSLCPIGTLPNEILGHVMALATHDIPSGYPRISLSCFPLSFFPVCRQWRAVALSTPELWTSFCISYPPRLPSNLMRLLDIVVDWLSRSGTLGLSIKLVERENWEATWKIRDGNLDVINEDYPQDLDWHVVPDIVEQILDVLFAYADRWEQFEWRTGWGRRCALWKPDQPMPQVFFPRLKSLSLFVPGPVADEQYVLPLFSATAAPRLRSLETPYFPGRFEELNLSGISHLHLDASPCATGSFEEYTHKTLLAQLPLCTSLTHLTLTWNRLTQEHPLSNPTGLLYPPRTRLPRLEFLEINDLFGLRSVLPRFDLPNLVTLKLTRTWVEVQPLPVGSVVFHSVRTFECKLAYPSLLRAFSFPGLRTLRYEQVPRQAWRRNPDEAGNLTRAMEAAPALLAMLWNSVINGDGATCGVTEVDIKEVVLAKEHVVELLELCPKADSLLRLL